MGIQVSKDTDRKLAISQNINAQFILNSKDVRTYLRFSKMYVCIPTYLKCFEKSHFKPV